MGWASSSEAHAHTGANRDSPANGDSAGYEHAEPDSIGYGNIDANVDEHANEHCEASADADTAAHRDRDPQLPDTDSQHDHAGVASLRPRPRGDRRRRAGRRGDAMSGPDNEAIPDPTLPPGGFVTDDAALRRASVLDPVDRAILEDAQHGRGIPITSRAQLEELMDAASSTMRAAEADAARIVTPSLAASIRAWRCEEGYSWRAVAAAVSARAPAVSDWGSNQLFGMALCEVAAAAFGEHYRNPSWN